MQTIIKEYLEQAKVGRKQSYKNMAVYPLLSTYAIGLEYHFLDEALEEALIEVVEVDQDGAVPELKMINKSEQMILIIDGEELVGAKQNRIVNTTILIPGNSTIVIPVSCVEQGRWSYHTPRFHSEERVMSAGMRAMKAEQVHMSLRQSEDFQSDQGAIWDYIAAKAERRGAESPSMAMGSIYEKDRSSLQDYTKRFRLIDSQVGAVFVINGKVVGLDTFGKPVSFSKIFKKLVESYALDAVDWFDPAKKVKTLRSEVTKFIKASQTTQIESRPSVGLGKDCRLESKKISGFAMTLDGQILHMSIFAKENAQNQFKQASRMERHSRRRQER
jgi:hypothetical protein